ncbi:MAG: neutral/alkaline non-lysosomal ceramidase N-terminal domain-containing protein [Verrucomicrobia bacterium]|nr:neutral/alkaline non-lysosomal ceramidase N-terminal domain-containing protein [Verrucomicrobiota bacterium]
MKKHTKRKSMFWKAGAARADISPREPMWLAGWANRTKPMQGVSQPVWAKALALNDGIGQTAVLVTSDLLGFSRTMTAAIAQRAQKRFGLDRARLILNASHNHSGPLTGDVLPLYFDLPRRERALRDRYTTWLLDSIVELIGRAIANLAPARVAFGQGLAGIAVNRRRSREGGRSLPVVVDQDVPVLSVSSVEGKLRAVAFGYACHPTCVNDDTLNGDYPGWAQQHLEEAHPDAIALFMQGCGGDANPLPRFRSGLGECYGRILAAAVEQVLESQARDQQVSGQAQGGTPQEISGPLRAAFAEAEIPYEPAPTREELLSLLPGREGLLRRQVEFQLSLLKSSDRRPRSLRYPIHVWQFGESLKLVALSSETVVDYATRFKQAYGWDNTWVSGYNDDYWCYIPSLRVWREGGYEGHTGMLECGLPGPFAPSVEEIIAAQVDELAQETNGQPRPFPRPSRHS